MRRRSSSTSSSDRKLSRSRAIFVTLGWTLLALVLIDMAVGFAFPLPADPRVEPNSLARYFGYGRSLEGKLAHLVGSDDAASSPIVSAGWLERNCLRNEPPARGSEAGVTIYGMSFSNHIAAELTKLEPSLRIKTYAGPGAGFNHSFACYELAGPNDPNKIQIIGILSSSVARMLTIGGLTTSFDVPQPFSYPRFHLKDAKLERVDPVVRDSQDFRNERVMQKYFDQMASEDAFYSPLLVKGWMLDRSMMVRLLRRAYAQASDRNIKAAKVFSGNAFVENPEIGPVMNAMLREFAASARAQGKAPLVILFQDRGTGVDSLYRLLSHELEHSLIDYVRTDLIASPTDSRNFLPDGHFTPDVDKKIADAVYAMIKKAGGSINPR